MTDDINKINNKQITISIKELHDVIRTLSLVVVSIDRIGSYESEISIDDGRRIMSDFVTDWSVSRKLATSRRILSECMDKHLTYDEQIMLEELGEEDPRWSRFKMKPDN